MKKKELLKSLRKKGFSDEIVAAFDAVRREDFVEESMKKFAYRDRPLPIGDNATISQPFTIAFMLNLLEVEDDMKILEIGSGCGYVLALLNELSQDSIIYGVEINQELAEKSKEYLDELPVSVINKDGYDGLGDYAPFDRIIVSAAYSEEPRHLFEQLKTGGILVVPVHNSIIKYIKEEDGIIKESHFGFAFVPMM